MEPFNLSTNFWNQVSPGHEDDASISFVEHRDNSPTLKEENVFSAKPPERPRSAFMCFMHHRMQKLQGNEPSSNESKDLLQLIATEWNDLSDTEQHQWEEASRNDRARYYREKSNYTGPSLEIKCRTKKHPLAPKRPMSAFLKFSQEHRSSVRANNPTLLNTDVSRILGEMWRNASNDVKSKYIVEEEQERQIYKQDIANFQLQMKKKKRQRDVPNRPVLNRVKTEVPIEWDDTLSKYIGEEEHERQIYQQDIARFHHPQLNNNIRQGDVPNRPDLKRAQTEVPIEWDDTPVIPRVLYPNQEHGYIRGTFDVFPKSHNPYSYADSKSTSLATRPNYDNLNNMARRYRYDDGRYIPSLEFQRNSRYFYQQYGDILNNY